MSRAILAAIIACGLATSASAEGFQTVKDRTSFLTLIKGKQLTRLGIKLNVTEAGDIRGSAFGRAVTGAWRWKDGFFCRDLYYGEQDLGPNCQVVKVNGQTLRFIADQGAGQYADLRLR